MRAPLGTLYAAAFCGLLPALCGQAPTFETLNAQYRTASVGTAGAAAAVEKFLPRFQSAARARLGRPEAGPFLVWILEHAGLQADAAGPALEALLAGPVDHAARLATATRLPYLYAVLGPPVIADALDTLAASEHAEVRATALYSRALLQTTEWGRRSAGAQRAIAEAQEAAARTTDTDLQARAAALPAVGRGVRVGEVAPEILGLDMDGVPFKLSDYRGKVVVLDFWGDW